MKERKGGERSEKREGKGRILPRGPTMQSRVSKSQAVRKRHEQGLTVGKEEHGACSRTGNKVTLASSSGGNCRSMSRFLKKTK